MPPFVRPQKFSFTQQTQSRSNGNIRASRGDYEYRGQSRSAEMPTALPARHAVRGGEREQRGKYEAERERQVHIQRERRPFTPPYGTPLPVFAVTERLIPRDAMPVPRRSLPHTLILPRIEYAPEEILHCPPPPSQFTPPAPVAA